MQYKNTAKHEVLLTIEEEQRAHRKNLIDKN